MKNRFHALMIVMRWVLIALGGFATSIAARADVFVLEKRQTDVRFVCMGLFAVEGRFLDVDGVIDVDEKAPEHSRVKVTIKSASLTTGLPLLDEQLKGDQFFNVAAYPTIDFKGRSTTSNSSTHAKIRGKLSIRGVTKPITISIGYRPSRTNTSSTDAVNKSGPAAKRVLSTKFKIRRSDFGMTGWDFMVADECEIQIIATLKKGASARSKSTILSGNRGRMGLSVIEDPKAERNSSFTEPIAPGGSDTNAGETEHKKAASQTIPLPKRSPRFARKSRKRVSEKKKPINWSSGFWGAAAGR